MRPGLALCCGLLLASTARGQEPSPPPVLPTEAAEPALPEAFLDQALRVDRDNRITQGRAQTPVTHLDLFGRLGRADLIARSEAAAARRSWLLLGGGLLGAAAIVAGAVLIATAPVLASLECESSVRHYNDYCVPRANEHNLGGTALIVTGVMGGLMAAGFAWGSDPRVLTRDETIALVGTWNSRLARDLRRPPAGLRLIPVVTPFGASLSASLRF